MKKVISLTLALVLALGLVSGCSNQSSSGSSQPAAGSSQQDDASSKETYVIRVGLPEALENPIGIMATQIKEYVEEKSEGQIVMELYPSNTLGGPREMLEAVGLNNLEMTVCTPTDLASFVPEMGILTFPYLFKDAETAHGLLDGAVGDELNAAAEKANFNVLGYPDIGFRQITNNVRPITCLEDFQGIKIRTRGVTAHLTTFKEFGANPMSVDFAELYASLQQKVVDAQENSTTNIYFNNFFEVQDYLSVTNTFFESWSIVISDDYFDALPAELQQILQDGVNEGVASQRASCADENDMYLEKLKEVMEVNEIADAEMDRIMAAAQSLYPQFAAEVGEDLVNRVLDAIA